MQKVLLGIDKISTFVGQAFSWLIVALTALMVFEIFARRFFDAPHAWAFDAQIQMYGFLFMTAGAYTVAKQGMVRGDVLYGFLAPRMQAAIDLVLYVAFLVPGIVALTYAGWIYAGESWAIGERSTIMTNGPPLYWFKSVIPFAGAIMSVQGAAEIARCVLCLRDGEWPSRQEDVVEVDVDKLKEMVHVKDEDLARLDELVVQQQKEKATGEGGAA
jgi:TRAP-type mannitol/chloroaromatic compound transport system permease small subunit